MSQTMRIINKIASILNHKPSDSASSRPSRVVRDSHQTIEGRCITNISAGTITGLIAMLALPALFIVPDSSAITLTIVPGTKDRIINIPPTAEGKFVASEATTANVVSTHAAGYTLTVYATALTDGTNTISPLSTGTSINAEAFSNAANTQYNNKWGYLPATYYNGTTTITNNTNFFPAPIGQANAATLDSTTTTTSAAGTNYNVSVGARIDNTAAQGSYESIFTFAVVGKVTPYSITYNANAGTDTVTNMPTPNPQTGSVDESTSTVNLSSTVPTREGYEFKGWCSTTTSDDTCTGTTYNPDGGGTSLAFPIDLTSASNTYTIYAMWKAAGGNDLYSVVAAAWAAEGSRVMTNDDNTDTGIKAAISASNSGVFKYDPSTFGASSDASNNHDIYFYRGILDTTTGSYGSNGDNAAHPNTVVLDSTGNGKDTTDTCWRIVRTTGSGGVKMIYQGKWTSANGCKNATTAAQVTTSAFDTTANSNGNSIVGVGYTYNSSYKSTTSATSAQNLFRTNTTYTGNNTRSTIKTYIEDTWYASKMTAFTTILEGNAGYCNDRTVNTGTSWTTPAALTTNINTPYTTATVGNTAYYFGSYMRTRTTYQSPTLKCATYSNVDRSIVDLYRYSGTGGAAGGTTGNSLKYPAALLTADEAAFAGSGYSLSTTSFHANSFLRSGSQFWLLSPINRSANGLTFEFSLYTGGSLDYGRVFNAYGVRPSISLTSGTSAASGSGTATDPWIVTAP